MLVRSLFAAAVGGSVFQRINVPAGALIGAMVGVAAVGLTGTATLGPGPVLRFAAFAIIGWDLGSQIDRSTLESVRSAAVPIAARSSVCRLSRARCRRLRTAASLSPSNSATLRLLWPSR